MSTTLTASNVSEHDVHSIHDDPPDPSPSIPDPHDASTLALPTSEVPLLLIQPLPLSYPSTFTLDTLGKLAAKLDARLPRGSRYKVMAADRDGHDLRVSLLPTVSPFGIYWAMTALAVAGITTKRGERFNPIPVR